jgi:hypothetical protein
VEKCGRSVQATDYNMERMRIAFWIPTATDPHSVCNTYCFFTSKIVAVTRLDVTLYVNRQSCYAV